MLYGLLSSLLQPSRPWGKIFIDFITGLLVCKNSASGLDFNAILVIVDRYLKIAKYIACYKTINSLELAKILWEHVFSIFGTLDRIVFDKGIVFTSKF